MKNKDYSLDKESIIYILKARKEKNDLCSIYDNCNKCSIEKFRAKYNIDHNCCLSTYIVKYLLGDNDATAEFFKNQYLEFREMCSVSSCTVEMCKIKRVKGKCRDLENIKCLALYIAIKLLKDV